MFQCWDNTATLKRWTFAQFFYNHIDNLQLFKLWIIYSWRWNVELERRRLMSFNPKFTTPEYRSWFRSQYDGALSLKVHNVISAQLNDFHEKIKTYYLSSFSHMNDHVKKLEDIIAKQQYIIEEQEKTITQQAQEILHLK